MENEDKKITTLIEAIDTLKGILQKINDNKGKKQNTILLIGNTGSGKSTIFNWLSGAKFNSVNQNQQKKLILIEQEGKNFSKQGDSMSSITFEPNFNMIDDHILIDFPGFKDTKGAENQLSIQLMFNEVVTSTNVKLAVVIKQYGIEITDRGSYIQELVKNTFTSQNAKIEQISFIINQFGEDEEDKEAINQIKKQLESLSQIQNDTIYKTLSENIILIRKVVSQESLFTDESRQSIIKKLKEIKPITYQPDKVDQNNIVGEYIETKLNRLFAEFEKSFSIRKDEARIKGEIFQFETTLNQKIQEINQVNYKDLNSVSEWMKKNILIESLNQEATLQFQQIYNFFFKYQEKISGFQQLKTNIDRLKVKIEQIKSEIQADIKRINEEKDRFKKMKDQQEKEHQKIMDQLNKQYIENQRRYKAEQQKKENERIRQKRINENEDIKKRIDLLKKQQDEDERFFAIQEQLWLDQMEMDKKIKEEKLWQQKRQKKKNELLTELSLCEQMIRSLQTCKQKYINEQKGIYMSLLGGDWSSEYNFKISNFDTQIQDYVNKKKDISYQLINY